MSPAPRHCPRTNGGPWLDIVNRPACIRTQNHDLSGCAGRGGPGWPVRAAIASPKPRCRRGTLIKQARAGNDGDLHGQLHHAQGHDRAQVEGLTSHRIEGRAGKPVELPNLRQPSPGRFMAKPQRIGKGTKVVQVCMESEVAASRFARMRFPMALFPSKPEPF